MKEARFNINPDNDKLQIFSTARHTKCILLPLGETETTPFSIARTIGQPGHLEHEVFKSLGEGLKRMAEVADEVKFSQAGRDQIKGRRRQKEERPNQRNAPLHLHHDIDGISRQA